ncbi:DNA excision repair protein ERCC-6-like 2 [Branchiostoma belcheri]|nr:DNA excision repair protein ERCC-6-like 2 [Branchiostoma belcheri]
MVTDAVADTLYFTGVAGRKDQQGEIFGISNMFALRMETSCLTRDLISRVDQIEGGLKITKFVKPKERNRTEEESIWEEEEEMEEQEEQEEQEDEEEEEKMEQDETDNEEKDEKAIKSSRKRRHDSREEAGDRDPFSMHTLASQLLPEDDVDIATVAMAAEQKTTPSNRLSASSESEDSNADASKSVSNKRRSKIEAGSCRTTDDRKKTVKFPRSRTSTRQSFGEDIAEFSSSESDSAPPVAKRKAGKLEVKIVKGKNVARRRSVSSRRAVRGRKGKISRTVSDVFRECGVAYTHRSDKVVGGSKAEAHMSHRAMEDVYELHQFSQQPANFAAEFQDSSEESDDLGPAVSTKVSKRKKQRKADLNNSTNRAQLSPVLQHRVCRINNKTVVIGGTPPATRREHFAALAKTMGCSQEELAGRVLQVSAEDRWDMLHTFYTNREADLGEIFKELRQQGEKQEKRKDST